MKMVPRNVLKRNVTLRTIEADGSARQELGQVGAQRRARHAELRDSRPIRVQAASLVKKGKSFSLGLNFDQDGPQRTGWGGRFNPIHTMLATGTDAVAGRQEAGETPLCR